MPRSILSGLCIPENQQRKTAFSDVYRAMITLGGRTQYFDIEHIALPFAEPRERALCEKYGLTGPALQPFYQNLRACLGSSLEIAEAMRSAEAASAREAVVQYIHEEASEREDGGCDLYLVTEPMTRLLDSDTFRDGQISVGMLARLGIRLGGIVHRLSDAGYHLGVLDLDTVCLVPAENGRHMAAITNLLFMRKEGAFFPYPAILPFNAPPAVREGREPTEASDTASLALLFTAILNGTYGQAAPDTESLPAFLPPDSAAALAEARTGQCSAREFQKIMAGLRQYVPDADERFLRIRCEPESHPPESPGTVSIPEEELCDFRLTDETPSSEKKTMGPPLLRRLLSVFRPHGSAEQNEESNENRSLEEVPGMPVSPKTRAMQKEYGFGSGTCAGCCNLRPSVFRQSLVCAAYGDSGSSRCEWDPESGACGLYGQPFEHLRPAHRTWLATYGAGKTPDAGDEGEQLSLF